MHCALHLGRVVCGGATSFSIFNTETVFLSFSFESTFLSLAVAKMGGWDE